MDRESYVYILTNKRNGTLYVGVTSDLPQRVWQHKNHILPGFSARYSIDRLVYYESYMTIEDAAERERSLKRWKRVWKLKLIESFNPEWRDLYDEINY